MLFIRDHLNKKPTRLSKTAETKIAEAKPAQTNWKKIFKQEATKLLKYLQTHYNRSYGTVTLVLMPQTEMDRVAKEFHPTHTLTDVLTFSYEETPEDPIEGDILLCPEHIFALATADNRPHSKALMETALHGMLHLYGLKHSYTPKSLQKVYQTQNTILTHTKINWIKIDELVQSL